MKLSPTPEYEEQDRKIIRLLQDLGSVAPVYPPELLTARRAAFLAQLEGLSAADVDEELSAADLEIVNLLGRLSSVRVEYPAELLAARRSTFIYQLDQAGGSGFLDRSRLSIQRTFQFKTSTLSVPPAGFVRLSFVIGGLIVAAFLGLLFFSRIEEPFQPPPPQAAATPTRVLPTGTGAVALVICKPYDQKPACLPGELDPGQDLADPANGPAQPAVSRDARSGQEGVHKAAYVNDGREGTSWISASPDSWIKIDLGRVTTVNTISLQKGSPDSWDEGNPGQFVISVARSDFYSEGDSSHDYTEYEPVFHSEQTGFVGSISNAETILTRFPAVEARFVKITFEKEGAAIEEVGVFLIQLPEFVEEPMGRPTDELAETTLTPLSTLTLPPVDTITEVPPFTRLSTATTGPTPIVTPQLLNTPIPLPTNTLPPVDTDTPVPAEPSATAVPPTATPEPIVITGNDQTVTFICSGNDVEVRGHTNTVTLLGSCSSITVTGNGNQVFWQSGAPVITNQGNDNIISQL